MDKEVIYKNGSNIIKGSLEEIYKLLSKETLEIINSITSKNSNQGPYLSKYGFIIKENYEHDGKILTIKEQNKILFFMNLPSKSKDVKYVLNFYANVLDKLAKMSNKDNNILSTKQLLKTYPELKVRKR